MRAEVGLVERYTTAASQCGGRVLMYARATQVLGSLHSMYVDRQQHVCLTIRAVEGVSCRAGSRNLGGVQSCSDRYLYVQTFQVCGLAATGVLEDEGGRGYLGVLGPGTRVVSSLAGIGNCMYVHSKSVDLPQHVHLKMRAVEGVDR